MGGIKSPLWINNQRWPPQGASILTPDSSCPNQVPSPWSDWVEMFKNKMLLTILIDVLAKFQGCLEPFKYDFSFCFFQTRLQAKFSTGCEVSAPGYFIGPGFSSKYQLDLQRGLAWRNNESFCENKANKIRASEVFLVNFRVNITPPTKQPGVGFVKRELCGEFLPHWKFMLT